MRTNFRKEYINDIISNLPDEFNAQEIDGKLSLEYNWETYEFQLRSFKRGVSPYYFSKPIEVLKGDDYTRMSLFPMIDYSIYKPLSIIIKEGSYHIYLNRNNINPEDILLSKVSSERLYSMLNLKSLPKVLSFELLDQLLLAKRDKDFNKIIPEECRFYRVGHMVAEAIINRFIIFKIINNSSKMTTQININAAIDKITDSFTHHYQNNEIEEIDTPNFVYSSDLVDEGYNELGKYIMLNDTPQSEIAGKRWSLNKGVFIKDCKLKIDEDIYPFSRLFSFNPLINYMSDNRKVVARYVKDSMNLINADAPIIKSSVAEFEPKSVNLLAVRSYVGGWTLEDGALISRSAAKHKMQARQTHVDTIKGSNVIISIVEGETITPKMPIGCAFVEDIATGELDSRNKITTVKTNAIVTSIEKFEEDDTTEYIITSEYDQWLKKGDKISDIFGNKATISKILPDNKMPVLKLANGKWCPVDLVLPPEIGKRNCPAVEYEERLSIMSWENMKENGEDEMSEITINPMENHDYENFLEDYNNQSVIKFYDNTYKVCFGFRRILRLNHNSNEKCRVIPEVKYSMEKVPFNLLIMTDTIYSLKELGCTFLEKEIYSHVHPGIKDSINNYLECLGYQYNEFGVKKVKPFIRKAPYHTVLNNITKADINNGKMIEDSLLDPKLIDKNVCIELPNYIFWNFPKLRKKGIYAKAHHYITKQLTKLDLEPMDYMLNPNGERYIMLPKGTCNIYITNNNIRALNSIQGAIMNITNSTFFLNKSGGNMYLNQINDSILILKSHISDKVFTKNGMFRNVVFPKVPGISAVFSNNPQLNLDEIGIPYRLLRKMTNNNAFKCSYNLKSDPTLLELETALRGRYGLVWRDPAHRKNNNLALKIVVTDGYTMEINPATIAMFDGDFDGDMGQIFIPTTEGAKFDLQKMRLDNIIHMYNPPKYLKELEFTNPDLEHMKLMIDHEHYKDRYPYTIMNIISGHENLPAMKVDMFKTTCKGIFLDHYKHQISAARDFAFIKEGVAMSGALGNDIRNLIIYLFDKTPELQKWLSLANETYHIITQAALDAKNSLGNENMVSLVKECLTTEGMDIAEARGTLRQLIPEELTNLLVETLRDGDSMTDIRRFIAENCPLFNAITSRGSVADLDTLAKLSVSKDITLHSMNYVLPHVI